MRVLKFAAVLMLVLIGLLVAEGIYSPYVFWYFIVPHAQLTVDGKPAQGWLHRSHHGDILFLTRHDTDKVETYRIWISHDGKAGASRCEDWTAPRFPAFSIGDVNPPCLKIEIADDSIPKPTPPKRDFVAREAFVEFTADDGSRLRVSW